MQVTDTKFLSDLGIRLPIVQAPMAGGATTPELVAVVGNAGGFGSLGDGYMTPDEIRSAIQQIRSLTDKPINVTLFAGGYTRESGVDSRPMLALLTPKWSKRLAAYDVYIWDQCYTMEGSLRID